MNTQDSRPLREERVPVLVVGGGLVGLSTALFLTHHGVRPLLLEKHEGTSIHPRARGFQATTVELLCGAGVGEAIGRAARTFDRDKPVGRLSATTLAGPVHAYEPFATPEGDEVQSPYPIIALGQDRLEPILLDGVRALGTEARFRHNVLGIEQAPDAVTAEVEDIATGEHYRVRADYLVAADGARSLTREALSVGRTGRGLLGYAISTIFEADLTPFQEGHPFFFAQITHPEARGYIVGSDLQNRWIYGTTFDPAHERAEDFTEARFKNLVRTAVGAPDLDVRIRGSFPWEVAERVAERFRVGRIFLAGDAAHQMTPAGGYGANTGIQDAANLAWKLAAVLRGEAGGGLLDTYDAERRPVAAATANQASMMMMHQRAFLERPSKPEDGSPEDIASPLAVTFGYRYGFANALPTTLTLTGEPGTRAPHVWLMPGEQRPSPRAARGGPVIHAPEGALSTRDLFGEGFVLLTAEPSWARAAEAVAARAAVPLRAERAAGFQEAYGIGASGASLVRPDGFVAARWADAAIDLEQALTAAIDAALHRAPARGEEGLSERS